MFILRKQERELIFAMNTILIELTQNLNEFSILKLEFDEMFDDRNQATNTMIKIVKKEVLDIADSVENLSYYFDS